MSRSLRSWLSLSAILAALALVAGCVTADSSTPPAEIIMPKEDTRAGIEQWKCGDYIDGCGFLATDCVTLTANLNNGTGEVKFGEFVKRARFEVEGIERRWDWSLNLSGSYDYAFIISVDGKGSYYNFRGSDSGKAKPTDLFKCAKR